MPIQKLCTVAEAVRLNEFACSLTLEAEGMEPQGPDQFVHVKCGHSRLLRRPISICGWGKNRLRIVFEVRGEGTAWLARRKAGDTLDVLGPLGRGFRDGAGGPLPAGGGRHRRAPHAGLRQVDGGAEHRRPGLPVGRPCHADRGISEML